MCRPVAEDLLSGPYLTVLQLDKPEESQNKKYCRNFGESTNESHICDLMQIDSVEEAAASCDVVRYIRKPFHERSFPLQHDEQKIKYKVSHNHI